MRRPTNRDYTIAHAWFEYHGAWWAWEELYDLIEKDRLKAWRMVQVMVAYAPDVAHHGLYRRRTREDLRGLTTQILNEAETSPRFRICLGMACGLPEELEAVARLSPNPIPLSASSGQEPAATADNVPRNESKRRKRALLQFIHTIYHHRLQNCFSSVPFTQNGDRNTKRVA